MLSGAPGSAGGQAAGANTPEEMMVALARYYDRRAAEYERVYHRDDPVRQREQEALGRAMRETLAGRRVLEVACGTGYWTEVVAAVARRMVGIDAAPETLAIARSKPWPAGRVEFRLGDAYALDAVPGTFDAGLACFWFSHVSRARVDAFLDGFHRRVGRGAIVFMADNVFVAGVGGERIQPAGSEDTYKRRTLADGSVHEVLKNYYTGAQLEALLAPRAADLRVQEGACFWWVSYTVR